MDKIKKEIILNDENGTTFSEVPDKREGNHHTTEGSDFTYSPYTDQTAIKEESDQNIRMKQEVDYVFPESTENSYHFSISSTTYNNTSEFHNMDSHSIKTDYYANAINTEYHKTVQNLLPIKPCHGGDSNNNEIHQKRDIKTEPDEAEQCNDDFTKFIIDIDRCKDEYYESNQSIDFSSEYRPTTFENINRPMEAILNPCPMVSTESLEHVKHESLEYKTADVCKYEQLDNTFDTKQSVDHNNNSDTRHSTIDIVISTQDMKEELQLLQQLYSTDNTDSDATVIMDESAYKQFTCESSSNSLGNNLGKKKLTASQSDKGNEDPKPQQLDQPTPQRNHIPTHTNINTHECETCGVGFIKKAHYDRHLKVHTRKRDYTCSCCDRVFKRKAGLDRHKFLKAGEKPHKCSICSAKFSVKRNLQEHLKTNHSDKVYNCSLCQAKFTAEYLLKQHLKRGHTSKRKTKFCCSICEFSFGDQRDLRRHLRTHSGERPHACSECPLTFARRATLKRHVDRKHTTHEPFQCTQCSKSFKYAGILSKHTRTVHKEKA